MKAKPTRYYSYCSGSLAKGCRQCVKGEKTVLFITGLCGNGCWYCPISDDKHMKDVVYANEWQTGPDLKKVYREIELCSSKGVGITGGDPLASMKRTVSWISCLKKRFGKEFHIHLYTPLVRVTKKRLEALHSAGLDEIRFHPQLDDTELWGRISLAGLFDWDIGVEVPVIPGFESELEGLIDFIRGKVKFINLNEFEVADNQHSDALDRGFVPKNTFSYGVNGSEKLGKRLVDVCAKKGLRAHYCSAKLKDSVQMANRIKKRAKNVRKAFDHVDEHGLLTRGAIYLGELFPDSLYRERLRMMSTQAKRRFLDRLKRLRRELMRQHGIPSEYIMVDEMRLRLLTSVGVVECLPKDLNTAIVREYPTHDAFQVELLWG